METLSRYFIENDGPENFRLVCHETKEVLFWGDEISLKFACSRLNSGQTTVEELDAILSGGDPARQEVETEKGNYMAEFAHKNNGICYFMLYDLDQYGWTGHKCLGCLKYPDSNGDNKRRGYSEKMIEAVKTEYLRRTMFRPLNA